MADILDELNSLIQAVSSTVDPFSKADIERWQKLFGFTHTQAEAALESHFNNLSRHHVSDMLWVTVREEQESLGHDKESYAFSLSQQRECAMKTLPQLITQSKKKRNTKAKYLFKLEAPLDTAEKVQKVAGLTAPPQVLRDNEDKPLMFVEVDDMGRDAIQESLKPATARFIALRVTAEKALSDSSIAPTLGTDATLPQHRLQHTTPKPRQNELPVPYFFYGTLAEPDRLLEMLGLSEEPILQPASVRGGVIRWWAGKYRALVDGDEKDAVEGRVYMVKSKEDEDALRLYEGGNYEVVRCKMSIASGEVVYGLTFRFCGDGEALGNR